MSRQRSAKSELTTLPNIGPEIAKKLKKLNIMTKRDFMSEDPYYIFFMLLKKVDRTLCRCVLASIVGANLGVPWHEVTKDSAKQYEKLHPRHKWGPC
ncbi:MAG: helix-hairpin-helix domain-containing protein [Candidatus Margulisiibacteriota bacterium]|nr:helix-hairpin-helix domain-containing protein [Candidatus Margulisiibacteriota bacterium]